MSTFLNLPPAASAYAERVDTLFWSMTAVCGVVALAVFVLMIAFCVRYRASAAGLRRHPDAPIPESQPVLEIAWIVLPLLIFFAAFYWAARLYYQYATPPSRALEIYVVAKQWMWKLEHVDGRREINELHVPRGQPIKLVMTSQDVIHSFYVPALRVKRDVLPGRYTLLWFKPSLTGEFHLFCAEYCGTDHARMHGGIIVMEPADYARWLSSGSPVTSLASRGAERFRSLGCSGCHADNSAVHAPSLVHLYGQSVPLADGRFVAADERYLRDSIMQPSQEVVAGYADLMPSFAATASEQDLLELVAYIKSLAGPDTGPTDRSAP